MLSASERLMVKAGNRRFDLDPGKYAYAGSALGPGGIEARVGRHLRRFAQIGADNANGEPPVRHWHIDHIAPSMSLVTVVAAESEDRLECRLTRALKKVGAKAVDGFGATDCLEGCGGHLLHLGEMSGTDAIAVVSNAFRQTGCRQILIFPPKMARG